MGIKNLLKNFPFVNGIVIKLKFSKYLFVYRKLMKNCAKGTQILIFPFEWTGDAIYIFSRLKSYLFKKGIMSSVCFVSSKKLQDIAQLFDIKTKLLVPSQMEALTRIAMVIGDVNRIKIMHHDPKYVYYNSANKWCSLGNLDLGQVITQCVFDGLELEISSPLYRSSCGFSHNFNILPEKTVILAPCSYTLPNLPIAFWKKLAGKLLAEGYRVYFNLSDKESNLYDIPSINLSYTEILNFVEQCGFFIGVRSGLCDVIAFAQCYKIALYSNQCDQNQRNFFNLNRLWKHSNFIEIEYRYNDDNLIDFILNKMSKKGDKK